MKVPVFVFDDCGKRKYLLTVITSDGNLEGVQDMVEEIIKNRGLTYSKYFAIYQGHEILIYQKCE